MFRNEWLIQVQRQAFGELGLSRNFHPAKFFLPRIFPPRENELLLVV